MRSARWAAVLALVAVFAMITGKACAQVESDHLAFFYGDGKRLPIFGGGNNAVVFPEGPLGQDPGGVTVTLLRPIFIDALQGPNDTSDELVINDLSVTFSSDNNVGGPDPAEFSVPLEVVANSDDNPNTSGTSDTVSFFSDGKLIDPLKLGIAANPSTLNETGENLLPFALTTPITVTLKEPDGSTSDKVVINRFSGTFVSDVIELGGPPTPGSFQFDEKPNVNQSYFSIEAASDVPEPSALSMLSVGMLPLGWILVRRRRSQR